MLGIKHALETGHYSELSQQVVGRRIMKVVMQDNILRLHLEGGAELRFTDTLQNCCEQRYMTTDDTLDYYVGAELVGAELKEGPDLSDGSEAHDAQFLEIQTTRGCFTVVNHNEHNGYYGGFGVEVRLR